MLQHGGIIKSALAGNEADALRHMEVKITVTRFQELEKCAKEPDDKWCESSMQ